MKPIIYVNSTVPFRAELSEDNSVSSFHYWGHIPTVEDRFYFHRRNRYEIILRSKIKGLDLRILVQVLCDLSRGYRSIYLVTQPDLLMAVPLIKGLFPKTKVVTWAWTAEEVQAYQRAYKACDHIFCLTDNAFTELKRLGCRGKSSVQKLGADPSFYQGEENEEKIYDVCLLGSADRDKQIIIEAVQSLPCSIVTTERTAGYLGLSDLNSKLIVLKAKTNREVIAINRRSKVSWVPLLPREKMPAGYTTLLESLLCGVPVVVADSSVIPKVVLSLPGIFQYRAGSVDSFLEMTKVAINQANYNDCFTKTVKSAAEQSLNGYDLNKTVTKLLF